MTQDRQPNNMVAGTARWEEPTPSVEDRLRATQRQDYGNLEGVEEIRTNDQRFETRDETFQEWHRRERRELREQGYDLLNGREVNGQELLGNIVTNLLGNAIRREDDSRATPYDHMRERQDGVQRDRHGYRTGPQR